MNTGQIIKDTRKEKGLTQQQLAEKTNLSISTIKRIEQGKVTPRAYSLQSLSDILGINLLIKPNLSELPNTEKEDNLAIILTSILLLFIPPLNIVYLLLLLYRQKRKIFFETVGRRLLVFQMATFISLILTLFAVLSITLAITGQKIYGQINSPLILYVAFITINISRTLMLVSKGNKEKWHYNDT